MAQVSTARILVELRVFVPYLLGFDPLHFISVVGSLFCDVCKIMVFHIIFVRRNARCLVLCVKFLEIQCEIFGAMCKFFGDVM